MTTFKEVNGKSIKESWWEYHQKNRQVFKLFEELAFKAIDKGKKKLSAKLIINVIRWEHYLNTEDETGFKINDAYSAYYGRLFIHLHPEHKDIFNFRELRSEQ